MNKPTVKNNSKIAEIVGRYHSLVDKASQIVNPVKTIVNMKPNRYLVLSPMNLHLIEQ